MSDDLEKFPWDKGFQELVLACMIKHPDTMLIYTGIIEADFFQGLAEMVTAEQVLKYVNKYDRIPAWETLSQLVGDELSRLNHESDEAHDFIDYLRNMNVGDVTYVSERVVEFCKIRSVIKNVRKVIAELQDGKQVDGRIVKYFEESLSIGHNINELGYIFHPESVNTIVDKLTKADYGVRTGFAPWDDIWKRGWGPGWLIVLLAPPKRFKTAMCVNLAVQMAGPSEGADVLYYACEISQEEAFFRALVQVSGIPFEDAYRNPKEFKKLSKRALRENIAGYINFHGYASKTATIADIKSHAKMVIAQYELKPKAIIIDYAETVKPAAAGYERKDYQAQADVYVDARAMGRELGCCVVMPDRVNKETVGTAVPSMTSFQGSFQKAGIVDIAIGLCATDAEYDEGKLRSFVFLNRHGAAYQHFDGTVDKETGVITVGRRIALDEDTTGTATRGRQQRRRPDHDPDMEDG